MKQTAPFLSRSMRFRDWACLRYYLVWAYEGAIAPHAHVGSYSSTETSCWLVRQGEVKVTTLSRTTLVRPGEWVFVSSPSRHQYFSKNAKILSMHFSLKWPTGEDVFKQTKNQILRASDHPDLEKSALTIVRQLQKAFPDADATLPEMLCPLSLFLKMQNLLPAWLDAYLRAQGHLGNHPRRLGNLHDRVLDALAVLDHWPLERKFDESSLLKQVGLGRSQLNLLFCGSLGMTPRGYLEQRKFRTSLELLEHTQKSIKEISFELGFRHESHFTIWFRRLQHTSPSLFRNAQWCRR